MPQIPNSREPRWHAMVAIFAVCGLRVALPRELAIGPDWLFLVVVGALSFALWLAAHYGNHKLATFLGYLVIAVVTADMTWSLCLLVAALPTHRERHSPAHFRRRLWMHQHYRLRLVVLAAGRGRAAMPASCATSTLDGAFLFPQMALSQEAQVAMGEESGAPASSIICSWPSTPAPRFRPPTAPCSAAGPRC